MKQNIKWFFIILSEMLLAVLLLTYMNNNLGLKLEPVLNSIIATIVVTIHIIMLFKTQLKKQFKEFKNDFKKFIIYVTIAILVSMGYSLFINQLLSEPENQSMIKQNIHHLKFYLTLPYLVLIVPFFEEMMFRFLLMGKVKPKSLNSWTFIIFVTVLFTIIHCNNLFDLFIYLPSSIILTTLYLKSKHNVWVTYTYHVTNNLIAYIWLLLTI